MANVQGAFDIIASQTIFGFGCAGCGTAVVLGAVGRSVKKTNRTLALGIVMAAGSFGQFIMVPSIGYLIEIFGWSHSLTILIFVASIMDLNIDSKISQCSFPLIFCADFMIIFP